MAFADGALSSEERIAVERLLENDPEARRMVAMFKETRALAREAFEIPADAPALAGLAERIRAHPTSSAAQATDEGGGRVVSFDEARRARTAAINRRPQSIAWAASIALLVGVGCGLLIGRVGLPSMPAGKELALGPVAAKSELAQLLERRPSGEPVNRKLVVTTFKDRLDRVCREIEILGRTQPAQPELAGVACRQPDGSWIVEGAARITTSTTPGDPGFVPSGANEKDALTSLLNLLGAKPALTAEEERVLLDRSWKQN